MPSVEKAGYWDHMLYQKHPISPIANPEDGKKIKQPRLIANIDAFLQAFPGTDPKILAQYCQSDLIINTNYGGYFTAISTLCSCNSC